VASVFARRAKTGGAAAFWIVAIALSAIVYSGKNVMEPIMEAQFNKSVATMQKANPNVTAEQIAGMKKFATSAGTVSLVVGAPIALLLVGLLVWVVGKPMGAQVTVGSSVMIASYSYIPRLLAGVVTDVQGLMMSDLSKLTNPSQLSIGPARFFDPDATNALLLALLTRLDLVTLWVTILLAVGLYSAGKLSKEKAITAGIVLWLIGGLLPLWSAFRQG